MKDDEKDELTEAREEKKKKKVKEPKPVKVKLSSPQVIAFRGNHQGINKLMQATTLSMPVKFKLFTLRNQIFDHHETKALFGLVDEIVNKFVEEHQAQPMIADPIFAPIFAQEINLTVEKIKIPIMECPLDLTAEDMSALTWIFDFELSKEEGS